MNPAIITKLKDTLAQAGREKTETEMRIFLQTIPTGILINVADALDDTPPHRDRTSATETIIRETKQCA